MTRKRLPKDDFFDTINAQFIALTYDDIRLRTGYSVVPPNEMSLESRFSRNVSLKIPIVAAAMDTVTEHRLAIALAKLGGLGIIHKNMEIDEQAHEVARVKLHLNALIEKPITVLETDTIEAILRRRVEKGYEFHTFPVLDSEGRLVGVLSRHDFGVCDTPSSLAKDVMSRELITLSEGAELDRAYEVMKKEKKKVLPLISQGGMLAGMYVLSDVRRIREARSGSSKYNLDARGQLRVGAAVDVDDALSRAERLVRKKVDVLVIDKAHGDSPLVFETLHELKRMYPSLDVVLGNISEPESAKRLLEAGADGIKVGQGPGSICTTRIIAGVGCPQVTAVYNCSKIADEYGVPVCADGGLRFSGDIPIAIGAGASSVMMGNMLAGTEESPGKVTLWKGRQCKTYRGMGSLKALEESLGSRGRYDQEEGATLIPEGVESRVPYKGPLVKVLKQYLGGLKRGMGYVGAGSIDELREKAMFWRITDAGRRESHPHDVEVTEEAPNYPGGQQ